MVELSEVYVSNNILKESSGLTDFTDLVPNLEYLLKVMPDSSLLRCIIDYEDEFVSYKQVEASLGMIDGSMLMTLSKDGQLVPLPSVSFPVYLVDGNPVLQVAVPPGGIEQVGLEQLERLYNDHVDFAGYLINHFAWFAELNSKDELKGFVEERRTYH